MTNELWTLYEIAIDAGILTDALREDAVQIELPYGFYLTYRDGMYTCRMVEFGKDMEQMSSIYPRDVVDYVEREIERIREEESEDYLEDDYF